MARISSVDYKEFPLKANKMRDTALQLNQEIVTSYTEISNMQSTCWHGARYNDLAKNCNEVIPDLEKLLRLVVTEIPFKLEQVANNYSLADTKSKMVAEREEPYTKVPVIPTSNETSMQFLTSEVAHVKSQVERSFTNVLNKLDEFESLFNSLNWESEAADRFRQEFLSLKKVTRNAIENIQKLFVTLMAKAGEEMQLAESSNTIN